MTQSMEMTPSIPQGFERFSPWFSRTFQLWSTHWQTWTLMTLLYLAISLLVGSLGKIGPYLQAFLVAPLLMPGLVLAAIHMTRGEPFTVSDIFAGTRFWAGALVIGLVIGLGAIAFGIGLLFTNAAFFFALPLLVDRDMNVSQALSHSWEVTKRDYAFFLVFPLVMALLASLGVLAFGVGLLFTFPWYVIAQAIAYTDTFPGSTAEAPMSGSTLPTAMATTPVAATPPDAPVTAAPAPPEEATPAAPPPSTDGETPMTPMQEATPSEPAPPDDTPFNEAR